MQAINGRAFWVRVMQAAMLATQHIQQALRSSGVLVCSFKLVLKRWAHAGAHTQSHRSLTRVLLSMILFT